MERSRLSDIPQATLNVTTYPEEPLTIESAYPDVPATKIMYGWGNIEA